MEINFSDKIWHEEYIKSEGIFMHQVPSCIQWRFKILFWSNQERANLSSIIPLGVKWDFGQVSTGWFFVMIFWNFLEDRKMDYLHGNHIYFSIGAWEQKLCPNKFKTRDRGKGRGVSKFFFSKFEFFWGNFFSYRFYFCLHRKLWSLTFGFVMRKLWTILFFRQLG